MLYIPLNPSNRILNNSKNTRKDRQYVYQSIYRPQYKYKINKQLKSKIHNK